MSLNLYVIVYGCRLIDIKIYIYKMRVCVIGAGTAGLCAAKHALQNGMEATVFEQASAIGGTWVYTDSIGKDEFGNDVHSSMYKGLQ